MFVLKTKEGKDRCVLQTIEYVGKYMNERAVMATLFSDVPIPFEVGDYLIYREETFTLANIPSVKKTAKARYTYSLKMLSESHKLAFIVFRDIVPNDNELIYPNHRQVDFTGDVTYLTERIQANLDKAEPNKWTIDVNPDIDKTLVRSISAQNSNCWNALTLVNTEYGHNFYTRGNKIFVGYDEPIIDKEFKYGYGEGAYEIERVVSFDDNIITKLSVTGTSRNLDTSYPKKPDWKDSNLSEDFFLYPLTLMIPEFKKDGKTDYVLADDKYIAKYGIREGSVVIDEIYPSITGSVNSQNKPIDEIVEVGTINNDEKHFEIWINNPEFTDSSGNSVSLKDLMIPTKSKLVMKDGSLQGFGFFVIQAHDEGDRTKLILERNSAEGMVGETQEKFTVPNSSIAMKPGDKFVFIEIFMPQSYIRQAEERLKERAIEKLNETLTPKYSYNINVSDIFVANKNLYSKIVEGQKLHLVDEGLDIDESILIESVSIKEGGSMIPEFKVTLNNEPKSSTKEIMKNQLSKIEGSVTNNYAALDELTSLLRRKLDKDVWDRVWEIVTKELGNSYIYGKMPVVTKYGLTMYAEKDEGTDYKGIYDGLPIDNSTIKRRADGTLYSELGEDEVLSKVVIEIGDESYESEDGVVNLPEYPDVRHFITISALRGYATEQWVNSKGYLTSDSIADLVDKQTLLSIIEEQDKELLSMSNRLSKLERMWVDKGDYLYASKSIVTDGGITIYNEEV